MRKSGVLILVFLICFASVVGSQDIQLAVTRIEPLGVKPETARMVEDLLQTEIAKLPQFSLVERGRLETVLQEQELQLSGITSAQSAAQAGNVLNVQKVLFGSLARYDSEYVKYLLSLRIVDVERAEVEVSESVQIRNDDQLIPAVSEIVSKLTTNIEVRGRVTKIEDASIYTSLGESAGIAPEDVLSVITIELIRDESGSIIMSEQNGIANLSVEKVSPEGSLCRILESAGTVEVGQTVEIGQIVLQRAEDTSTLEVRSVPDRANVFMDGKFLGVTPLKLNDLEPGTYHLEIRSGAGYKPYQGRVTLRAGRSVSLERELEADVEVEDILLFGKIPGKLTDPKVALRKALIPGLGAVYNGYQGQVPVLLFGVLGPISASIIYASSGDLPPVLVFGGVGLVYYGLSLYDAWAVADDGFLYPTYAELYFSGGYMSSTASPGASFTSYAIPFELIYEARRYYFNFGTKSNNSFLNLYYTLHARFIVTEHFFVGIGSMFSFYFWYSDKSKETENQPSDVLSPSLSISYKSLRFEVDLMMTPYSRMELNDPTGEYDNNFFGFRGKLDLAYFFRLKTGIRASVEYANMKNIDTGSDYQTQELLASEGLVLRL